MPKTNETTKDKALRWTARLGLALAVVYVLFQYFHAYIQEARGVDRAPLKDKPAIVKGQIQPRLPIAADK